MSKSIKVPKSEFDNALSRLLHADPIKREDVKTSNRKPTKVIQSRSGQDEPDAERGKGH